MLIDCDSCTARPHACGDCIVTHLLQVGPVRGAAEDPWPDRWETSAPADRPRLPETVGDAPGADRTAELTESEVAAVAVLSAGGLVPPLRLVTPARPAAPAAPTAPAGRAGRRGHRSRTG